jgi:hypothetical protein
LLLAAYGCKTNSLNAYRSHAVSRDEARDSVTVQLLPQGGSGALFVLPKVPLVVLHLRVKKLADVSLVLQLVDVPMLQVATVRRAIHRCSVSIPNISPASLTAR